MKIVQTRIVAWTLITFLAIPGRVLATGIPTVDVMNILQTTVTAFESIEQTVTMVEQLESAVKQYQQQIAQLESMTGSRGMGALLTGAQKAQDRRWAPDDIDQTLAVLRAGGIPGSTTNYKVAIERMQKAAGAQSSSDMHMADDGYMANYGGYYDEYRASNMAALGLSESAYSDTDKRTQEIEALMAKIDQANDQKAALDLMNTLIAEMLVLQNESVRLQAALLQNQATANFSQTQSTAMEAQFHNRNNL